jgi:GNAT superfamily N-acetyltransferase
MGGLLPRIADLVRLIVMGRVGRVWTIVRRRLYSNAASLGLRRDVTVPFPPPPANQPIQLRPLSRADDLSCLDLGAPDLTDDQVFERLTQRRMLHSRLQTCYVAVGPDGTPCYMEWLILARDYERLRDFFGDLYPRLAPGEALLEGAYTPDRYRGQGIMTNAVAQLAARAAESGAKWVLTFVDESCAPARQGCERAGFRPYVRRIERYRLLRRRITFLPLTPDPH